MDQKTQSATNCKGIIPYLFVHIMRSPITFFDDANSYLQDLYFNTDPENPSIGFYQDTLVFWYSWYLHRTLHELDFLQFIQVLPKNIQPVLLLEMFYQFLALYLES